MSVDRPGQSCDLSAVLARRSLSTGQFGEKALELELELGGVRAAERRSAANERPAEGRINETIWAAHSGAQIISLARLHLRAFS